MRRVSQPPDSGRGRRRFLRAVLRHRRGVIGLSCLALIVLLGLLAPAIAPYSPTEQNLLERLEPPSAEHWLGTDALGQDILTRVLHGARYSLGIGLAAMVLGLVAGSSLGLVAGFYGGVIDGVIMRVIDILMAFPGILLALVFVTLLGNGLVNVVIAISVFSIPQFCRIVRAETIALREREYVHAARAIGANGPQILVRYIVPNAAPPVLVLSSLRLAAAILTAAALGFLGLGVPPHLPEWGAMLNQGRPYLRVAPHVAISPGLAIAVTTIAVNLVGDMLRDVLDPRMRV